MNSFENRWDETEKSYKFVCDIIDHIDDSLDSAIRSVFETNAYQKNLIDSCQQPQNATAKKSNISDIMAPFLLKALNNPFFDVDEIKDISKSTGLTERQIRDFLRNQRKRKILYLNKLHDEEKQNIEAKLGYLYDFIEEAVNEYLSIENRETGNEIDEFICFPSNDSHTQIIKSEL